MQPTTTPPATCSAATRHARSALLLVLVATLLLGSVSGCNGGNPDPIEIGDADTRFPTAIVKVLGVDARLHIAHRAADRRSIAKEVSFDDYQGVAQGVLYVYQPDSVFIFRQEENPTATAVAFLDTKGRVIAKQELPPTPTRPELTTQVRNLLQQLGNDPRYAGYIQSELERSVVRYSFPVDPGQPVTYILQMRQSTLEGLQVEDRVEIPEIVKTLEIEPATPTTSFFYSDRALENQSRAETLSLLVGATEAERNALLEPASLHALSTTSVACEALPPGGIPDDVRIKNRIAFDTAAKRLVLSHGPITSTIRDDMIGWDPGNSDWRAVVNELYRRSTKGARAILLVYDKPQQIRFDARGLETALSIVPLNLPKAIDQFASLGAALRGQVISLLPDKPTKAERKITDPTPQQKDEASAWYRPWEYRSVEEYDALMIVPGQYFESRLTGNPEINIDCPVEVLRLVRERSRDYLPLALRNKAGKSHALNVRLLEDHIARRYALGTLALPEWVAPVDGGTDPGTGERGDPDEWVPTMREPPMPSPDAYLVRYDRSRIRPLFAGGLRAPFDMVLFDDAGKAVEFVAVTEDDEMDLEDPIWSYSPFRTSLVVQQGWLRGHGFVSDSDTPTFGANLRLPNEVRRRLPGAERYRVEVGGHPIWVELAYTDDDRSRGLMWRRDLPTDCGMLFLFAPSENSLHSFWMANCYFDQTIAYVTATPNYRLATIVDMDRPWIAELDKDADATGRARTIDEVRAISAQRHGSGVATQYALEMERGWFKTNGVSEGDKLEIGDNQILSRFAGMATVD